jgi:hypothetical protein
VAEFLPSRELDALVAESVLGWKLDPSRRHYLDGDTYNMIPLFSQEPQDAIHHLWDRTDIQWITKADGRWLASFVLREDNGIKYMEAASAYTVALAVVLAALLKKGLIDCPHPDHLTEAK